MKALFEHRMLPRVMAGSSVGSIVAGIVATRTDDELRETFRWVNALLSGAHHSTECVTTEQFQDLGGAHMCWCDARAVSSAAATLVCLPNSGRVLSCAVGMMLWTPREVSSWCIVMH